MISLDILTQFLSALFSGNTTEMLRYLKEESIKNEPSPLSLAMLRIAIQQPGFTSMYYRQLLNHWRHLKCPPLKPNSTASNMVVVADATMNGMPDLLEIFSAAYGINLNVRLSEYDSVEQQVFASNNQLNIKSSDIVVVILSEQWLRRHLGSTTLISLQKLIALKNLLKNIFDSIQALKPAKILIGNFPSRSYIGVGGTLVLENYLGWSQAITHLNDWLSTQVNENICLLDVSEAISLAGGSRALGRLSYFRAHIPFEESGMITVCREIAAATANVLGKAHRALLTDFDNTLWGGEIGELGLEVNSRIDNPDGLGYQLLQNYIRDLKALGILLAAVSRNDPSVAAILDNSSDIILKQTDFASMQINWGAKSKSVSHVVKDFQFGTEFMLFVDDNPVEIAEVLSMHPYIDIILAGPSPDRTLERLCEARYFNTVLVFESDLERHNRQLMIRQQNETQATFRTTEEFLNSLNIQITVEDLTENNEPRVVQLLQKTNQFNLTTRRHQLNDLKTLKEEGAQFGIFSYSDNFGHQGIISVVILLKEKDQIKIDSWLMSCRVLNRGVENTVFKWILQVAQKNAIIGEYIATQKNGLVRELFHQLGFQSMNNDTNEGAEYWIFNTIGTSHPANVAEMITC